MASRGVRFVVPSVCESSGSENGGTFFAELYVGAGAVEKEGRERYHRQSYLIYCSAEEVFIRNSRFRCSFFVLPVGRHEHVTGSLVRAPGR